MKRKDTKCYKELVEDYCSSRLALETADYLISNAKENIEKSQKKYAEMDNVDMMIKSWFDAFVMINQYNIDNSMSNKESYAKSMENSGKLLIEYYDEDLDKLYASYELF